MSHFYASQGRQSYLYPSTVANLQTLIEKYGDDPNEMAMRLQTQLETYFSGYFDTATVAVISDDKVQFGTRVTYIVRCFLTQGGQEFALEDLIGSIDGTFKRIIGYNNDGTPIVRE